MSLSVTAYGNESLITLLFQSSDWDVLSPCIQEGRTNPSLHLKWPLPWSLTKGYPLLWGSWWLSDNRGRVASWAIPLNCGENIRGGWSKLLTVLHNDARNINVSSKRKPVCSLSNKFVCKCSLIRSRIIWKQTYILPIFALTRTTSVKFHKTDFFKSSCSLLRNVRYLGGCS